MHTAPKLSATRHARAQIALATVAALTGAAVPARAQSAPEGVPPELIAYPSLVLCNGKVIAVDAGGRGAA